jgi:60 kDa SS-A/Ro ribonucleoprotein
MTRYSEHVHDLRTAQTEAARADQKPNHAGGYAFEVSKWVQLDRFLILGAEGGTYYVTEQKLTQEAAGSVRACLAEDGAKTVARIVEISDQGRAPKNDPAIFALAMCAAAPDPKTRQLALAALPKVCRIGTHLFHFAQDLEGFRGWSRALRSSVAAWYTERPADKLALQVVKYQQRDGWSHKDLLRLSHAKAETGTTHAAIFRYVTKGAEKMQQDEQMRPLATPKGQAQRYTRGSKGIPITKLPAIIQAFEEIHVEGVKVPHACELIRSHDLPHECVPNELKNDPAIWEALSENMGITAMIRNLAKMTAVGLIKPLSSAERRIAATIANADVLKKGRMHPLTILYAMKTYASGHGLKGSLSWAPSAAITDALNEAFYLAFATIEPTGKNHLLALDVSGSMGDPISGTSLSCRDATAALAMVTARTEQNWHCMGFSSSHSAARSGSIGGRWGGQGGISPIPISPRQRLDDVVKTIEAIPMGGTDCALPMIYAQANKLEVDVFHVYTDNETWAGSIHPFQALRAYRQASGRNARLVVVGMTATKVSIADPTDAGMLDVVGFDTSVPAVMADFARGAL